MPYPRTGHCYADDTQVYISAPATSVSATVRQFMACVEAIDAWMSSNRLKMNADKTQLIWLGAKQQLDKLSVTELSLLSARVTFSSTAYDLGFLLDNQLAVRSLRKLQAVQNAAARFVTGAKKFDHVTLVLRDLHWLPVHQRIKYKLAMTVYKCVCYGRFHDPVHLEIALGPSRDSATVSRSSSPQIG